MAANKQKLKLMDIFRNKKNEAFYTGDLVDIMRQNGYIVSMKWVNTVCREQERAGYLDIGHCKKSNGDFESIGYYAPIYNYVWRISDPEYEDIVAQNPVQTKTLEERIATLEKENTQLREALVETNKKLDEIWNLPGNPGCNERKRKFEKMANGQNE